MQLERLCALAAVIDRNLILLIPAQHQLRETAKIRSSIRIHQFCSGIAFHALEIIAVIEVVVRQAHAVPHLVEVTAVEVVVIGFAFNLSVSGDDMPNGNAIDRISGIADWTSTRPPVVIASSSWNREQRCINYTIVVAVKLAEIHAIVKCIVAFPCKLVFVRIVGGTVFLGGIAEHLSIKVHCPLGRAFIECTHTVEWVIAVAGICFPECDFLNLFCRKVCGIFAVWEIHIENHQLGIALRGQGSLDCLNGWR